jgi:hypothetical protein
MAMIRTKFYDDESAKSFCHAGPNIETSTNATSTGGNLSGVKVGEKTTETLGFYGATGVAQQTGVAVTAAAIHAALVALGLITA